MHTKNQGHCLKTRRSLGILTATVLAFLALAGVASAQDAGYVRVVGPKGPMQGASTNPSYKDWIVIRSVLSAPSPNDDATASREASAPSVSELTASPATGKSGAASGKPAATAPTAAATPPRDVATGQTSGKRMHKPFVITKEADSASPSLRELATSGAHFSEVDVVLVTNGRPAARCKLSDVMISSIDAAGGGDRPVETVTFTYTKVEWTK